MREDGGDPTPTPFVVALIENRAKEVGVAALDTHASKLYIQQHVETTRTFANTLAVLEVFPSSVVLVVGKEDGPDPGSVSSALQGVAQQPLPRAWYDDAKGFITVAKCASAETAEAVNAAATTNSAYLGFGAAGALLRYMEQERGLALIAGGLEVHLISPVQYMRMDRATVEALELVKAISPGPSAGKWKKRNCTSTLLGLLNNTVTKCGAQLLRGNILQPLRHVPTLRLRQEGVAELVGDETLLANVVACLSQLPPNLDKVCGNLSLRPAKTEAGTLRRISAMISSCILLQELLRALPALVEVLQPASCAILETVAATCGHDSLADLGAELAAALEDDVQTARSSFLNRTQQCFAVRAGVHGLLDVARATYCRVSEAVQEMAERYRELYRLPHLKVNYSAKKGFVLVLSTQKPRGRARRGEEEEDRQLLQEEEEQEKEEEEACSSGGGGGGMQGAAPRGLGGGGGNGAPMLRRPPGLKIPAEFSVLSSTDRAVHATTNELNAINARLRDAGNDCLILTEQVLEVLSERVVSSWLPLLHRVVDSVALLDMLASFATFVATAEGGYVRPALTEGGGPLAIVEGRHPIVEVLGREARPYVPNDTYLAFSSSFHVITGPNMSGKSTYLRQVALTCIMAQIGCFVPCKFASIPPLDRLLTRIGTGDSLETNSSSFMVEMQETAHILGAATPRSLVLVDELGRATSTVDGLGVAWAVSEQLIACGAGVLFATHFHELTHLAVLYPNCRAWHFDVAATRDRLDFSWRLRSGGGGAGHYGLQLAQALGFPEGVMAAAAGVVAALDSRGAARLRTYSTPAHRGDVALWGLAHKLACVAQSFRSGGGGQASQRALQKHLRALKAEAEELLAGPSPLDQQLAGL